MSVLDEPKAQPRIRIFGELPAWTGFVTMISICAIALCILSRRIRAAQVVR